jgi:uncharacterized protein (TIGR02246 family)
MSDVIDVEGIGAVYAQKLKKAGIATTDALLKSGATPAGRQKIAEKTGISGKRLLRWINHVDLFRVNGIQKQYAELLEAAGVDTIPELAQRDPSHLHPKLAQINQKKNLVGKLPGLDQVANWVSQAKKLPRKITYFVVGVLLAASAPGVAGGPIGDELQAASQVAPSAESGSRSDDEKAIRATVATFTDAFQKGDAKTIASLFTEDGEAVDADGGTIQGREAIAEHYGARFATSPGDKMETTIETIKFLAPGVARETGTTQNTPSGGNSPTTRRYTAMHVKQGGNWLLASVRELPDKEISHHERLKELEWLIGDWVEESDDAVVTTSFAWSDNDNFLLRSFDVRVKGKPALTGTQRIGWDPLTKQIKSWVFDSRGGYGEGLWMRSGNQWVIKASGVRPDGRTATATQVLTLVDRDTMRWKSIDRTLGEEIVSEIDEITMVRKPPQPKK